MGADSGLCNLQWLSDEAEATLEAARSALENYLRDPGDRQQLQFCRAYLHQVAGSMDVADCRAGAHLLAEMEALVDALLRGESNDRTEAGEALSAAIAAVPDYLARTIAARNDQPAALLMARNDLRALRGQPLATETDLFAPDLAPFDRAGQSLPAAIDRTELSALCRKLRQIYQLGLLSLLKREPLIDLPLRRMSKVAERMAELFTGQQREWQWRAGHAVLVGLDAQARVGPALRLLFRELDRDLRACSDPEVFATTTPPAARALLKNLLYYVAISGAERPEAAHLHELFRLDQALRPQIPAADGSAARAPERLQGEAVETSLRRLQDLSDQLAAAGTALDQAAEALAPPLLELCTALAAATHPAAAGAEAIYRELTSHPSRISWPQWADRIDALAALLSNTAATSAEMPEDPDQRRRGWINSATMAVVATVRGLLDEIKDAVVSYISARNNPLHLEGAPEQSVQIARALEFIGQDRLSLVADACGRHIAQQLMRPGAAASWPQLDALADTLVACEYCLEALARGDADASGRFLQQAEVRVGTLTAFAGEALPEAPRGVAAKVVSLPTAPAIASLREADVGADPELCEIFVAEARDVLESLRDLAARAPETDTEVLTELRRGFHTLKGSGRMVGATAIAELAWAVENLLNRIRDGLVRWSAPATAVVGDAIAELPALIEAFAAGTVPEPGPATRLRQTADELARGGTPAAQVANPAAMPARAIAPLSPAATAEATAQIGIVAAYVAEQQTSSEPPPPAVARALHTLVGCCERTGNPLLPRVIRALEALANLHRERGQPPDPESLDLFTQALDASRALFTGAPPPAVDLASLGDHLDRRRADLIQPAARAGREHLRRLMAGGLVELLAAPERFASTGHPASGHHLPELAAELEQLAQAADTAELPDLAELASLLAAACRRHADRQLTGAALATLRVSTDLLLGLLDAVAAGLPGTAPTDSQRDALRALGAAADVTLPESAVAPVEVIPGAATPLAEPDRADPDAPAGLDRVDAELAGVFLAEGADLAEQLEHSLHQWQAGTDPLASANTLKRALHTLKGGARMAGCRALGTLCHDFETLILRAEANGETGSEGFFAASLAKCDRIESELERIRAQLYAPETGIRTPAAPPAAAVTDAAGRERDHARPTPVATPAVPPRPPAMPPVRAGASPWGPAPWRTSPATAGSGPPADAAGAFAEPREMVKIAAPILDNLVNLVDETSISRSRIEQQIHQFHALLEEMETTVARFHDQVRRLSLETEAQKLQRREAADTAGRDDEFDPLEMDRYSQLQQLTRGLEESASDLQDLKETLVDKAQDTETLLVQQARINRDLHENLTLTRMVPFARVVPRLRRIVRQTASELDKSIELHLDNVEGEMDRAVLERIVPSLEHLIRNAIDHGIEAPERRRQIGKPETGSVAITFAREAGDIVIRLSDDGRGLDVEAIRAKAESQQLLPPGADLGDQDIMRLIFRPGFSTSQAVNQISGRGLGMDVVDNEVRRLGGSVSLTSRRDYGTEFTLRLPFTASVNRALLMKAGGETYGVLLNSVAGVVKLNSAQLASLHANPGQPFPFEGEHYRLCTLGSLLGGAAAPLPGEAGRLSVLLLKGNGDNVAVQVDALEPSQEVVVKSLGPQFAKVRGLAGATLLGDGRVVPILDLAALIADYRGSAPGLTQSAPTARIPAPGEAPHASTVVVVDDSVTVRKATSRLLERNGYRVLTARDGLEAMQLLQDVKPDLMLLDIEMPRMDGFEVARQVRASELLRSLPIVMITSRSGDKHRSRALALGVNRYLGKPYQEDVLLAVVEELLAGSAEAR
jgi:chemosensory pili system protein ChpA (sensor histidine kinase/response regulator)